MLSIMCWPGSLTKSGQACKGLALQQALLSRSVQCDSQVVRVVAVTDGAHDMLAVHWLLLCHYQFESSFAVPVLGTVVERRTHLAQHISTSCG
jgi:hypothetical protein